MHRKTHDHYLNLSLSSQTGKRQSLFRITRSKMQNELQRWRFAVLSPRAPIRFYVPTYSDAQYIVQFIMCSFFFFCFLISYFPPVRRRTVLLRVEKKSRPRVHKSRGENGGNQSAREINYTATRSPTFDNMDAEVNGRAHKLLAKT